MNRKEALPVAVPHFNLRDRKLWLLFALVGLTVYVIATQWNTGSAPKGAASSQNTGRASELAAAEGPSQRASTSRVSAGKEDPLKSADPTLLPQLSVDPKSFDEEKRNLFSFFVPPPPVPPPAPPPPDPVCGDGVCNGAENWQTCESDCPKPPPPPVCGDKKCEGNESFASCPSDCDPPPPPEINLKFIGYMNYSDGPVAFLTDGKEVYMGRVDDIIANRYRVVSITENAVELGYVSLKTGQSRKIPFQGESRN